MDSTVVRIPLSQGHFASISAEDEPIVSVHRWFAVRDHNRIYAASAGKRDDRKVRLFMHRELCAVTDPRISVDHANGDGLDNRRENLRPCRSAQNQWNRGLSKANTSGFKGVSSLDKKWMARIRAGRGQLYLGLFDTPEQAALAYDEAASRLHGEFASLNFPPP